MGYLMLYGVMFVLTFVLAYQRQRSFRVDAEAAQQAAFVMALVWPLALPVWLLEEWIRKENDK